MIIPEDGKVLNYRYISSIISINIVMKIDTIKQGFNIVSIEGPFIGKYFAFIHEDYDSISLISCGKGLYYGDITNIDVKNPVFKLDKSWETNKDIPIGDNYILNLYKKDETIKLGEAEYQNCIIFNLIYDKGKLVIAIKEGIGLILLQNVVNNIIKDEIRIKGA